MRNTYLSIDLDYWCRRSVEEAESFFENLLARLPKEIGVCFAPHHHGILPHINSLKGERIINIDFHSDLTDLDNPSAQKANGKGLRLNCGTWGNLVAWERKSMFIWAYPHRCCIQGKTNGCSTSGWCHRRTNPFRPPEGIKTEAVCSWKRARLTDKEAEHIIQTEIDTICGVGICLSKSYLVRDKKETIALFDRLFDALPG